MRKQYLLLALLAMTLFGVGCSSIPGLGGGAEPTPLPFNRFRAQDVLNAMTNAGLPVQNPRQEMLVVGRGAPATFSDRYVFEVARIAPAGGQILVFDTTEAMQAWLDYINQMRADPNRRRDVVYVYTNANILLQLNANLTPDEARPFSELMAGLGG